MQTIIQCLVKRLITPHINGNNRIRRWKTPKRHDGSIAYELIPQAGGMFDVPTMSGEGYAQKDPFEKWKTYLG